MLLAPGPCPCGRGFPLIVSVLGRANDLLADAAGNTVHSEFFTHLFREDQRIGAFQVLYDAHTLLVIVQCSEAFDERHYCERIGAALQFASLRFARNRPFLRINNGKHRFVLRIDNVDQALAAQAAHG